MRRSLLACYALLATTFNAVPVTARELPTVPDPIPVTVESGTTALLVLDIVGFICGNYPECTAMVPNSAALVHRARDAGATVVYSSVPLELLRSFVPDLPAAAVEPLPAVAPQPGEPLVASSADKFFKTDLEDILRERGIQTVIVTGVASNGAVLYTSHTAAVLGLRVIVAEDVIAGDDPFDTMLARYQVLHQPDSPNPQNGPPRPFAVTLSRSDLITFE